jgi:hypothetical protein
MSAFDSRSEPNWRATSHVSSEGLFRKQALTLINRLTNNHVKNSFTGGIFSKMLYGKAPGQRESTGAASTATPADEFLVIREISQLRILRSPSALRPPRALAIELPGLSGEEARAASERILSYSRECGCSLGAKCMLATFAFALSGLAFHYGMWTSQFIWRLPWTLPCAFAGAGLGKWAGVARARARINKQIDKLLAATNLPAAEV